MSNFFLTEEDAKKRFECFAGSPSYEVYLCLPQGKEYHGLVRAQFNLKHCDGVFLEFNGKAITSFTLNGNTWSAQDITDRHNEGKIILPSLQLCQGENLLIVKFFNNYSKDGNGLHTFVDQTGEQYCYTQTEPYCCNRVFPVFDQPDLKARLTLLVAAQSSWTVITNTPSKKNSTGISLNEENVLFTTATATFPADFSSTELSLQSFAQTPLLSSYLFGLAAGPFKCISSQEQNTVPMSIYCRSSLYTYALEQQAQLFRFTSEGIRFYENFFKTPYPFEKYDLVFCPEYTVGAMEYPGIITFNDAFIVRDTPTVDDLSVVGKVNLHELAHMWFGNLVTMRWWNDLWLNESFADFSCYMAGAGICTKLGFATVDWMSFMNFRKNWGYDEDQMISTHPISCEVVNTSRAEALFDGITYSKGMAVLKQLYFLIGGERFSENLGKYFSKFAWKNSTLNDFLTEMSRGCVKEGAFDMERWNLDWIETAGLNVLEAVYDEKAERLTLKQSSALPQHSRLRYHKIKIAFFNSDCTPVLIQELIVNPEAETHFSLIAKDVVAILPNYDDWDYVKVALDSRSSQFFLKNFGLLSNLNQFVVLRSLFDMVRDAKILSITFFESLIENIWDIPLSLLTLRRLGQIVDICLQYVPKKLRESTRIKAFDFFLQKAKTERENDKIKIYKTQIIHLAETVEQVDVLREMLEETHAFIRMALNSQEQLQIVIKLCASIKYSSRQKLMWKTFFLEQNKSDIGRYYSLCLEALTADEKGLSTIWNEYISPLRTMSYKEMTYSIAGFFHSSKDQRQLEEYYQRFLLDFPTVANRDTKQITKSFFDAFFVGENISVAIQQLETILKRLDSSKEFNRLMVMMKIDELRRKSKAWALYKSENAEFEEFIFSSEQVSEGHADKMCDQVSDAIVDAVLQVDSEGKAAVETLIKSNNIIVAGEISCSNSINIEKTVRACLENIGYNDENIDFNPQTANIQTLITQQSSEIASAVHINKQIEQIGAGDQGLMIGYATDETEECLPLSFVYATKLLLALKEARISGKILWLRPDAKSQVSIRYSKPLKGQLIPLHVEVVLISTQHTKDVLLEEIYATIKEEIILKTIDSKHINENTKIIINPSASFVIGGPKSDAGVTGRKIIADTYGGWGGHGGGAFSGKDPSKVDRSAAYAARWIAKSLVKGGYCRRCLVQISYALGLAEPLALYVDSYGTARDGISDNELVRIVQKNFDIRPGKIIQDLDLKKTSYLKICTYGHFMKPEATWEIPKKLLE